MRHVSISLVKVFIGISLLGSVAVQLVLMPLLWTDLEHSGVTFPGRLLLVGYVVAIVLTMQVFAVCVWRLLTLVRRGSVFSPASFAYINVIVAAFAASSVLTLLLGIALAPGETAPGIVALTFGVSLVLGGVSVLVVVMRRLLVQAIEWKNEAHTLRSELDEVI